MKKIILLLLVLPSLSFAGTYLADDNNLKLFKISKFGPTRVTFLDEKIVDVFYYPEAAAKVVLHKTGVVFVVPNEAEQLVYLTLMGERGAVQDLRLRATNKQPEPIGLKVNELEKPIGELKDDHK